MARWWDQFWQHPPPARGRSLTRHRTAEVALELLRPLRPIPPRTTLRLLDLGCGDGVITSLLLADDRLELTALDLSSVALGRFRRQVGARLPARLRIVRGDVYCLPFADAAFDAVVSFGYASAATYEGVERELARVLRTGGVAVADFANPSLYHWLAEPRGTWRWYRRFRDSASGQYHFGRRGIAGHFRPAGLSLQMRRYLNAYPPLDALARTRWSADLDRLLARAFGPLLGRVLLVRLRRL